MIPIDQLHELFRLDENGFLHWNQSASGRKKGQPAGSVNSEGYRLIGYGGNTHKAHRIIFAMTHGRWPAAEIDHINGNRDDNRPCNLREATRDQNSKNQSRYRNNTSGVPGVTWSKAHSRWRVTLQANGRKLHAGLYDDLELAALVSDEARRIHFGAFARAA